MVFYLVSHRFNIFRILISPSTGHISVYQLCLLMKIYIYFEAYSLVALGILVGFVFYSYWGTHCAFVEILGWGYLFLLLSLRSYGYD